MNIHVNQAQHRPVFDPPPSQPTHEVEDNEVASVEFTSGDNARIQMHESWAHSPLSQAMDGNTLDLNRLTPEILEQLDPTNLNILMDQYLAGHEVDVRITNGDGSVESGEADAATAVAAMVWGSGNSEAFAKVFAAAPGQVLEYLTDNGSRVLTAENIALIMSEMQASATGADGSYGYDPSELDALGSLVQTYLDRNVGDDPAKVQAAIEQLMGEVSSTLEFTPENAGVVIGALTSGMLKHFDAIEASTETRNAIINGVLDAVSGTAGAFGPWGAAASVGIGAMKNVYLAADKPENHEEFASRFQGAIQLEWLQHPPEGWSTDDVQNALHWVDTTILNNGQR